MTLKYLKPNTDVTKKYLLSTAVCSEIFCTVNYFMHTDSTAMQYSLYSSLIKTKNGLYSLLKQSLFMLMSISTPFRSLTILGPWPYFAFARLLNCDKLINSVYTSEFTLNSTCSCLPLYNRLTIPFSV